MVGEEKQWGLPLPKQSSGDDTDIRSEILAKLDRLKNDIAASRKGQAHFSTELKDLKIEFNKFPSNLEIEL